MLIHLALLTIIKQFSDLRIKEHHRAEHNGLLDRTAGRFTLSHPSEVDLEDVELSREPVRVINSAGGHAVSGIRSGWANKVIYQTNTMTT